MRFSTLPVLALIASTLASLPSHLQAYAYDKTGNRVGCINGYGWFTSNLQWCAIFNTKVTADPNSQLKGYDWCSTNTGTLECYPNSGVLGSFYSVPGSGNLAVTGLGEVLSIDALPADPKDTKGVPIKIGGGAIELSINVKSTSG